MFSLCAIILLSSCSLAFGKYEFKASNCENVEGASKTLELLSITPNSDHIIVPGVVGADIKFKILKTPVSGKNYTLKVNLVRPDLSFLIDRIPCVDGFGSCKYNFCELLARKAKELSADGVSCPEKLPCSCEDLKPGTFDIPFSNNVTLATVPALIRGFIYGDYKMDATITRDDTKEVMACIHLEFSMESKAQVEDCTGLFCDN